MTPGMHCLSQKGVRRKYAVLTGEPYHNAPGAMIALQKEPAANIPLHLEN